MTNDLIIGMAGAGGDGIVSAGESLIASLALEGYHAIMTKSFGSQIRGGESSFRLRLSSHEVPHPGGTLDLAVALNWEDFLRFGAELAVGGRTVVVYEAKTGVDPDHVPLAGVRPAEVIAVPFTDIARREADTDRAKNTVVLGLVAGWLGIGVESLLAGLRMKFGKKSPEVLAGNERAFAAGLAFARQRPLAHDLRMAPPDRKITRMLTDGNDMCGAAAIFSGCTFFGGYPITPSTEIMQYLGREIWKYGGAIFQAEDEMAGIGAAVGASFAGSKAMTATSGPGLSLKTEILGLATIAELPVVCVNVQRGGPSTGIPTKSEQSDLFAAVFSAHGDVVRPVLAPTCVADTFATTVEAFNIAEEFQTPVLLLTDQEIAQRKEIVDPIDVARLEVVDRCRPSEAELAAYERFRPTDSGVSPLSQPGVSGGNYLASGIEHNASGSPTASGEVHARMNEKRIRKLDPLKKRDDLFVQDGDEGAPLALVAWGSLAGVAREALTRALAEGLRVKLLVPKLLYPIAEEVYREFFFSVSAGLVIEQSHQGQLYRILRMYVDVPSGMRSFAKSGSNPISSDEVLEHLRHEALSLQREAGREVQPQE